MLGLLVSLLYYKLFLEFAIVFYSFLQFSTSFGEQSTTLSEIEGVYREAPRSMRSSILAEHQATALDGALDGVFLGITAKENT